MPAPSTLPGKRRVQSSGGLGRRPVVVVAGSVDAQAGIAAQGLGQAGVQPEQAIQASQANDALDQPPGADQLDGPPFVAVVEQAPTGADQHAKAHRIDEACRGPSTVLPSKPVCR